MSVEYRADRKKWGYRFYLAGTCYKKYAWDSKTEAKKAEQEAQVEARKNPALQPTALITAASAYLIGSAKAGRGQWRLDGLHYTFNAHIVPHFGEATLLADISPAKVKNFIEQLKRKVHNGKKLKNKTIKNIITDLSAMYNWAMESHLDEEGREHSPLVNKNPVTEEVKRTIGSTKSLKRATNPRWFDIAAMPSRISGIGHGST